VSATGRFGTALREFRPLLSRSATRLFLSLLGWCSRGFWVLGKQPRPQHIVMHIVHNLHIEVSPQHPTQQSLNIRNRFKEMSAASA
jgi:hypothetical protein